MTLCRYYNLPLFFLTNTHVCMKIGSSVSWERPTYVFRYTPSSLKNTYTSNFLSYQLVYGTSHILHFQMPNHIFFSATLSMTSKLLSSRIFYTSFINPFCGFPDISVSILFPIPPLLTIFSSFTLWYIPDSVVVLFQVYQRCN